MIDRMKVLRVTLEKPRGATTKLGYLPSHVRCAAPDNIFSFLNCVVRKRWTTAAVDDGDKLHARDVELDRVGVGELLVDGREVWTNVLGLVCAFCEKDDAPPKAEAPDQPEKGTDHAGTLVQS